MFCLRIIDSTWEGITRRTLNSAWEKLWPDLVSDSDFEGFGLEAETGAELAVVDEIVSLRKFMSLEVDENDVKSS